MSRQICPWCKCAVANSEVRKHVLSACIVYSKAMKGRGFVIEWNRRLRPAGAEHKGRWHWIDFCGNLASFRWDDPARIHVIYLDIPLAGHAMRQIDYGGRTTRITSTPSTETDTYKRGRCHGRYMLQATSEKYVLLDYLNHAEAELAECSFTTFFDLCRMHVNEPVVLNQRFECCKDSTGVDLQEARALLAEIVGSPFNDIEAGDISRRTLQAMRLPTEDAVEVDKLCSQIMQGLQRETGLQQQVDELTARLQKAGLM